MVALPNKVAVKNVLVCTGLFYISRWVALPLAIGFGKVTKGIIYSGEVEGAVVEPLVLHMPIALVAYGVGAAVIWFVDSPRPIRWALFVALLYSFFGFFGYHWAHPPTFDDRVFQTAGAFFPGITCFLGGLISTRRRVRPGSTEIRMGSQSSPSG